MLNPRKNKNLQEIKVHFLYFQVRIPCPVCFLEIVV